MSSSCDHAVSWRVQARRLACVTILAWSTSPVGVGARKLVRQPERALREACLQRFKRTDFNEGNFQNSWMTAGNMSAFIQCLFQLRTKWREREKAVHSGGVHYPTLVVTNHRNPVVSTSGASWCWLDRLGIRASGLDPEKCCDLQHGPRGFEVCWDSHFTFELCCQGDLRRGELPHFFSVPAMDINVGNTVKRRGTFDMRMSYGLQALCRHGDTVIDVGANLGGFTVPLAERVGPKGEVHAFEAYRKVFQHLNANVALNGLTNVYTYNVAIGRESSIVQVYPPDLRVFNVPSAMRVQGQRSPEDAEAWDNVVYERKQEKLQVRPLDSFDFGEKVDFMKIDVEFMELEVVLGARETIRRYHPVIWAENEPFFKNDPPDRTFVDTMAREFDYVCQAVADLELLCAPPERAEEAFEGIQKVMKHLNVPLQYMSLQKVLTEVDPGFSMKVP